jgi:acyl-coenzyme A thioesterase PaaI-like protein
VSTPPEMHPWPENEAAEQIDPAVRGGVEYAELVTAEREALDALAAASFPPEAAKQVTELLERIRDLARRYEVGEPDRRDGWRTDLLGRGNALLPPYVVDVESQGRVEGRVRFTRFFLGGNAAAHGGTLPLLFDDLLGRVTNRGSAVVARTAYLKVNYRKITPIGPELRYEAWVDRVEGRKKFAVGRLLDAEGNLLADADGLFVELLPGQP